MSLDAVWRGQLERLSARDQTRRLDPLSGGTTTWVERGGKRLLNLASNNYLGLADDSRVVGAAHAALDHWGVGAGASRLVSGDAEAHHELERSLSELKMSEAALVYSSGYAANLGLISTVAGPRDRIFADELNHASLNDGCRLSGARFRYYGHRRLDQLEQLLRMAAGRGRRIIVTDAVFSMDADLAPLPELVDLARRWDAALIVDDAHGTGVVGEAGRGTLHHFGLSVDDIIQVATFSKALGVQGGAVVASQALIDVLVHRSRSFVYSTALAPVLAVAALTALRIARDEDWRRERLAGHLAALEVGLRAKGLRVVREPPAPMLLVMVEEARAALQLARMLEEGGVLAPAIRAPTVREGTSRIRLTPMATHSDEEIGRVVEAFR